MDPTAGINPKTLQILILLSLVTLPFKALALWKSARRERKGWFVALLVFNTFGILDIIYYFFLDQNPSKKTRKPIKNSTKHLTK